MVFEIIENEELSLTKSALYKIVKGIKEEWQISQVELARILHRSQSTVATWFKRKAVDISGNSSSPNDRQIYELIEFYDAISSMFPSVNDQIMWLKGVSPEFSGHSPLKLIESDCRYLFHLHDYIKRIGSR